jgi:4-hydroxyphenylpyruvate dioxygenase
VRKAERDHRAGTHRRRRLAELSLEQLSQLVGLVRYDASSDPFPIAGWDALVWVVGNATQTALFFQAVYGMELIAYSGSETGRRGEHAYVLKSGASRFVFSAAVDPASPLMSVHASHGDGIADIALQVVDVDQCIAHARAAGATVLEEPHDS